MRRYKENVVVEACDVQVPIQYYQHYLGIAMARLSQDERRAVYFRFLKPRTIAQVADRLGLSWKETDALIDQSIAKVHACFRELMKPKREKEFASEVS